MLLFSEYTIANILDPTFIYIYRVFRALRVHSFQFFSLHCKQMQWNADGRKIAKVSAVCPARLLNQGKAPPALLVLSLLSHIGLRRFAVSTVPYCRGRGKTNKIYSRFLAQNYGYPVVFPTSRHQCSGGNADLFYLSLSDLETCDRDVIPSKKHCHSHMI